MLAKLSSAVCPFKSGVARRSRKLEKISLLNFPISLDVVVSN